MLNSTARTAPHRRDQADATGPRSATAAGRLALPADHLAGACDAFAAAAELKLVAERAEAFARELGAVGTVGGILAHRAALLSVRLDDLGRADVVAVRAAERRALAAFDADRADAIAELLAEAESEAPGADPAGALAALAAAPDGLAGLLRAWRGRLAPLRAGDPAAGAVVARWLRAAPAAADLVDRAEAEFARLVALVPTLGPAERALAAARAEAGRLARLDPSPAATLARRHEAAAERGMFRAIRLIGQLNRQAGRAAVAPTTPDPTPCAAPAAAAPPPPPDFGGRRDPLGSFRAPVGDPLGSFRAPADEPLGSSRAGLDPASPEARRRRPDPARLAAGRR